MEAEKLFSSTNLSYKHFVQEIHVEVEYMVSSGMDAGGLKHFLNLKL